MSSSWRRVNALKAFLFVAVEKQRPFCTGVYVADEEMIKIGREHAMEDLRKIAKWKAEDSYPGYSDRAEMISLPSGCCPRRTAPLLTINLLSFTNGKSH